MQNAFIFFLNVRVMYSCMENPMDREAWQATVHGSQRVRHDLANTQIFI